MLSGIEIFKFFVSDHLKQACSRCIITSFIFGPVKEFGLFSTTVTEFLVPHIYTLKS